VSKRNGSAPTRRNAELLLIVLALFIGLGAWANVDLAMLGTLGPFFVTISVAATVLALAAHIAVRFLASYADPVLLPSVLLLNLLGLTMIHRLDLGEAARAVSNNSAVPSPDATTQLTWTALGVALFILTLLVVRDHRRLQRYTYTSLLVGLLLLMLPLAPGIGATINGATLWVRVGPLSFQPAEIAKILLTIFFAGYLVVKRDSLALVRTKVLGLELPRGRAPGRLLVAWAVSLGVLIFERDLGTSLLFFGLFVGMLYVATQRVSWVILGALLFIVGSVGAYLAFNHVRVRVQVWLDPFAYQAEQGYQIVQSIFGLASGGLFGSGWGQGFPLFVPYAKSDFIISAFGEELGYTGLAALLMLYAVIVTRGMRASVACRDSFGTLLAAGLSIVLALQVFVVVGGVTRLIPLTGLTTPFLAAGGSALVANWIMIALLMRVSDTARRPAPVVVSPDDAVTAVIRL
jgi:cell division protein FtsW (lipid II flippase)